MSPPTLALDMLQICWFVGIKGIKDSLANLRPVVLAASLG